MDVVRGNPTLFMRRDEVEAAWAWVEPILEAWQRERRGAQALCRRHLGAVRGDRADRARRPHLARGRGLTAACRDADVRTASWAARSAGDDAGGAGAGDRRTSRRPAARTGTGRGRPAVLEITLRTPAALEVIRAIAGEVEGAVVGAGTVLTPQQYRDGERAGARFVVSPGATPALLGCRRGESRAVPAGSRPPRARSCACWSGAIAASSSSRPSLPAASPTSRRLPRRCRGAASARPAASTRQARRRYLALPNVRVRRRLLGRARAMPSPPATGRGSPRSPAPPRRCARRGRVGNAMSGSDPLCRVAGARAPRRGHGQGASARPVRRPTRERFARFSLRLDDLLLDYSKNRDHRRDAAAAARPRPRRPTSRAGATGCSRASRINTHRGPRGPARRAAQPLQPADPGRRRGRHAGGQRACSAQMRDFSERVRERRLARPHRRDRSPTSSTSASAAPTSAR